MMEELFGVGVEVWCSNSKISYIGVLDRGDELFIKLKNASAWVETSGGNERVSLSHLEDTFFISLSQIERIVEVQY